MACSRFPKSYGNKLEHSLNGLENAHRRERIYGTAMVTRLKANCATM